jgi:apolipoprotein N-acyltransferase
MQNMFLSQLYRHPILFSVFSGAVLGLSLISAAGWPLSFVALAPLLYGITRITFTAKTLRLMGYVLFTTVMAIQCSAMFIDALPLTWALKNPGPSQYGMVFFGWVLVSLSAGLPGIGLGQALYFLRTHKNGFIYGIPAAWVLSEYATAYILSIVLKGNGSPLGIHLTSGSIGYVLADSPLLPLAAIGGVFLLSYCIILSNTFLVTFSRLSHPYISTLALIFVVWFSLFFVAHIPTHGNETTTTFSVINAQIPASLSLTTDEKDAHVASVEALVAQSQGMFVVLPEASRYLGRHRPDFFNGTIARPFILVDSGRRVVKEDASYRSAEYFDTSTKKSVFDYKHVTMPLGEYMPSLFSFIARVFGEDASIAQIAAARNFTSAPETGPVVVHGLTLGTLFCNEIWSPSLYRNHAHAGAAIFINLASHSWYHWSPTIYRQVRRAAQVRAAESLRPLLMSNDLSPALITTERGQIIAETSWKQAGVLETTPRPSYAVTPYMGIGPYWFCLYMILVLGGCIYTTWRSQISRQP